MMVLEDYVYLGMVFLILLRQIGFAFFFFLHYCHEQQCPRNICPGCYVLDNGVSFPQLSSDIDQAVRLLFPEVLVLVLLSMLVGYFNGCAVRVTLVLQLKIKITGELSLLFTGVWFDIYAIFLRLHSEKYKIVS